jgi:glycosyltransferase involved in cell wall biosynthesis
MKVLMCHNYYQEPGGEDQSFEGEIQLLESRGHEVIRYTRHNDDIRSMSHWKVARQTLWNRQTYIDLRLLIRKERPELMHCTNIFPLISPAAYSAARAEGVPVVQHLRNYRMFCSNSLLMRDDRVCEDCLGKRIAWPAVVHGCYRESRAASAVVVAMQTLHSASRTWQRKVNQYVALTEFARQKYASHGLPIEKISVKPNFVFSDPKAGVGGDYAIFAGRLSREKGIETLLTAWPLLKRPVTLRIVGDGPMAEQVRAAASQHPNIQWLGRRPIDELLELIGRAACLVMPSICYEGFPRTIVEAYSKGTPVIASRLGAMAEIVHEGRTGLFFEPGHADQLAEKVDLLLGDSATLAKMRRAARHEYESRYTADANYGMLMSIYQRVLGQATSERSIRQICPATPAAVHAHQ